MENCTVESINNDFLSQSYSQSIERIAGIRDHIFSFQIPKKLLEVRKKAWVNLFDKYSDMSDDIELNVDTLEPDEEEKEDSEEESYEQRIPMRKPRNLIQYWINTGNSPYEALLDENELSETGTSLSEKEITVSLSSSVAKIINNEGNMQEYKNNELCLTSKEYVASKPSGQSTTNIVTSGNIIQHNMHLHSYEKIDKLNVLSTSKRSLDIQSKSNIVLQFDQTSKQLTGDDVNNSSSNQDEMLEEDTVSKKGMSENIGSQEITTKDTSLSTLYRKKLYTGRNSPVDLILTEKHSINRLSMNTSGAKKSLHPALDSDCMTRREALLVRKNKKLSLYGKRNLGSGKTKRKKRKRSFIFDKNITDTNNELSNNNRIQNYIIDSSFKISSDCNNSDKRDNILFSEPNANIFVKNETRKQNLASLNINPVVLLERITPFKRHESKSAANIQNHITRENSVHNYKYLNKFNKLNTCEIENVELETIDSDASTILIYQCKTNSQCCASKESNCSVNLRLSIEDDFPISSTEEKNSELSSLKNTDISRNKKPYTTLKELPPQLSVNKDCTNMRFLKEVKVTLERLPSSMESQILKKDDTISQNNVLNKSKTLSSNSYGANKIDNVKFREIKVSLERLPALINKNYTNTMESEILNNYDTQQKEILNNFKTHSSNLYGKNRTDNAKLQEVKIAIERLPPNVCFNYKNIISENTNLHNNKRGHRIEKISKIPICENVEASIQTVNKVDTKSKKYNNPRISDTSDNVAEDQIFDKTKSDSQFQYKNDSKVNQCNDNKYSILSLTSSDEDDFVRLIQRPKKRVKLSKNDELLNETNIVGKNLCNETNLATNKDKCYSRNLRTVTFSSKEAKTKESVESSKGRKESNRIEKSFDNTTASLEMRKNGKFLISNESDSDSVIKNLNKRKKRTALNYNKSNRRIVNNNNQRCSNDPLMKKDRINYKNDTGVVFFQTKMFNTNSSDSEENNSYTAPIRKTTKNSFVHHKSQYHNHANFEELVNDSAKIYSRKHSSSLNSSFENHNVANRIHDIKNGLRSTSKKTKINKQLANKEFNDNINSRVNNKRKNMSSSFINDTSIRDTTTRKKTFSNISLEKNNFSSLSKSKHISDKFKNSATSQHNDVKSTKVLMFQTKSYCDSDSNESL